MSNVDLSHRHVVSRPVESRAVADFVSSAAVAPGALVVEGVAGIGKTTLWLAALEMARERGFRTLSARAAGAESVLAYTALADMLAGVDASEIAELPPPQRIAAHRILLGADADGVATDRRAVGAAFLSIITRIADDAPVLLAIDDLQWVDSSSAQVIGFAARRLAGRVGVVGTVRTDPGCEAAASWLQLPRPDSIQRITLRPMSIGGLHAVVSERFGRSFSRPAMVRISEVSGGNPFYAVELARTMNTESGAEGPLPGTLTELVRARVGNLQSDANDVLLAASCLGTPTVDLVTRAVGGDAGHVVKLLEYTEAKGIIGLDGHRVRFVHPLLARGVYTDAAPSRRRKMHRRLADIVDQPELRARHLALAATTGDPHTLQALDAAAESARQRGAPGAAAELIDLAIGLGGDNPERRIAKARHLLSAGDSKRAGALLDETIDQLAPGVLRAEASSLLGFVHLFGDSFLLAEGVLEDALDEAGEDVELHTRMLITLSFARYNAGHFSGAARSIENAVTHAQRLGQSHLLSQALSMRATLRILRGEGLEESAMARALTLEDPRADAPMAFRPSMQNAMLLGWTGQLDRAHRELAAIRRRCVERGEENELIFVAVHSVLVDIWRGDFVDATLIAEDTVERALQLGGDVPLFVAMTIRAALATYAGREEDARRDIGAALAASQRSGANLLVVWTLTTLGFLELSLGNHEAALDAVGLLRAKVDVVPDATEIPFASFVPDAAEALIALGRLDEAERLVDLLEGNGARVDRAWMLAVGARCRAMLCAAAGDLEAAGLAAERAMTQHERLPMPFEHARTQLTLGQLQRRLRQQDAATATLREALGTFEMLGTPLWAERARVELARTNVGAAGTDLTQSERQVAELAASGMHNRDIAAALFISPKTVEVKMTRVYRKLGIRSRAELGRHVGYADS